MRSAHFQSLVEKNPANDLFRFSLAQSLVAEGQLEEAVPHLIACASKTSDWMFPRILLGKALVTLGRKNEARPWLRSALQLAIDQSHEDPENELRAMLADIGE